MAKTLLNPYTGRFIKVDGPSHLLVKQIQIKTSDFNKQKQIYLNIIHSKTSTKELNHKYDKIDEKYFCGEAGGYPKALKRKFPVDSESRCHAALSYARYAPNPAGIEKCALKIAKKNGWACGKKSKK